MEQDNTIDMLLLTHQVVVIGGVPSTLNTTTAHLLRSEGYAKQACFGVGMGEFEYCTRSDLYVYSP